MYKPGETWDGVFGALSSAYEECRAECTGVYLCDHPLALSIFGHEGEEGRTITYVSRQTHVVISRPLLQQSHPVSLISLDCLQLRELALHGACRPVRRRACRCSAVHNVICMCGLEFYTPGTGWRQAHMQGRWAILRLMIECGAVDILVRARVVFEARDA